MNILVPVPYPDVSEEVLLWREAVPFPSTGAPPPLFPPEAVCVGGLVPVLPTVDDD